jgi:hypothetical protein
MQMILGSMPFKKCTTLCAGRGAVKNISDRLLMMTTYIMIMQNV